MPSLFATLLVLSTLLRQNSTGLQGQSRVDATRPAITAPLFQPVPRAESAYISILEKTNQQLSLWANPYGLMVGSLGILFAIMAIVAGLLLYRQGKDYRDTLDKKLAEYRAVLDGFISDKNAQIEALKLSVHEVTEAARADLVTKTGAARERFEEAIGRLEEIAKGLRPQPIPSGSLSFFSLHGPASEPAGLRDFKCEACSSEWKQPQRRGLLDPEIKCPNCGKVT